MSIRPQAPCQAWWGLEIHASGSSCLGSYPMIHQTSTTVLGWPCWLGLPPAANRSPYTPVVNPPEQQLWPMKSRRHRGWAWKGEQTLPSALPIASPLILIFFFLEQIWFPEINYSTGGDSRCIAALLEQRIKRHIGHSSCTSQTLKFKIFINDLLKL